jgi:GNAT superfamily N-acetyltransferase
MNRPTLSGFTQNPVPVISTIRPEQIDAAVELFGVQLKEHQIEIGLQQLRGVIEQIIADDRRGFILVATTAEGKVVGSAFASAFFGMEHGGLSGWLEELYVLPSWRGKQIGSKLVSEVVRIATTRGWRALDLEIEADHARVASLYQRHGFLPHSRSRFYRKLV